MKDTLLTMLRKYINTQCVFYVLVLISLMAQLAISGEEEHRLECESESDGTNWTIIYDNDKLLATIKWNYKLYRSIEADLGRHHQSLPGDMFTSISLEIPKKYCWGIFPFVSCSAGEDVIHGYSIVDFSAGRDVLLKGIVLYPTENYYRLAFELSLKDKKSLQNITKPKESCEIK